MRSLLDFMCRSIAAGLFLFWFLMEKQGWISLHRKIEDHWLLKKRTKSQFEAWIIMLLEVNHNSEKIYIDGSLIECKRGESIKSLKTWANLFGWSKSKVSRFFNLLEKDNMIVLKSERKTTHLKICNYNTYQDERNKDETKMKQRWNDHETIMDTNNNDNNDNKEEAAILWKSVFLNNPGKVELDFVEYLQTKFNGKTKTILYSLRENNFHSIRKMKDALDEFGNIKPIEAMNGTYKKRSNNLVTAEELKQDIKDLYEGRT